MPKGKPYSTEGQAKTSRRKRESGTRRPAPRQQGGEAAKRPRRSGRRR